MKNILKNITPSIFLLVMGLSLVFFPLISQADDSCVTGDCPVGIKAAGNVLTLAIGRSGLESNLTVAVGAVIQGILLVVGSIFFIMMVYAGVLWLTAKGNDTQIEKAKNIITESVIGLAITFAAYAITYFVVNQLGGI